MGAEEGGADTRRRRKRKGEETYEKRGKKRIKKGVFQKICKKKPVYISKTI